VFRLRWVITYLCIRVNDQAGLHGVSREGFFFFQPSSVHGWISAFLLNIHRLCGAIEGRLSHFSATLAQDGLAECDQPGKIPLKYSATAWNRTRMSGRTIVISINSPTELSSPGHGENKQ